MLFAILGLEDKAYATLRQALEGRANRSVSISVIAAALSAMPVGVTARDLSTFLISVPAVQ